MLNINVQYTSMFKDKIKRRSKMKRKLISFIECCFRHLCLILFDLVLCCYICNQRGIILGILMFINMFYLIIFYDRL